MADTIAALSIVVDSSGAVAGYRQAATAAEQTAQAELQLARAAEASARATQAGIAATTAAAQANLAGARATLQLAQAQQGATSAAAQAAQAATLNARASAGAAQASLAQARAVTQTAVAATAQAQATVQAVRATTTHGQATAAAGQSAKGAGIQFGNLGQQLQDVAVQASSGTSALVILAQQGPQIASAFGPAGVAIGAAVAIAAAGTLIFFGLGSASEKAAKAAEDQADKTESLAKALRVTGDTAEAYAASLANLTTAQQNLVAASLSSELDKRRDELAAAKADLEAALQDIPSAARLDAGAGIGAGPDGTAFALPTVDTAQTSELNGLLETFRNTGEGADFLRTRIIELLQQQGVSATAARTQADAVINTASQVTALDKATEELAARQRIAAGTASDLDKQLVNQADSAAKAATAFESYTGTLERLQQRNAAGANKREQFIQEQLQSAKVTDLAPTVRPEAEQRIRQEAGNRFDADERIRLDEKRADVASRLRIQEHELSGAIDERIRTGERAYAQTLTQTEGDTALAETAKRIALREYDRQQAIEKRNTAQTKANATADRRTQFETGIDQEAEQLGALKGAIDQGSAAYEKQANVLEVMRRVRAAGFDLSTREGQEVLARAASVRDETEQLQRQAGVRKDLDNIIRRASAAPGISATGQDIDLPGLVGLTPQAIDEVVARAEFVRGVVEKLGDQPPEVIARETERANQAVDLRKVADDGTKGARATAQLNQEAEQQERLGGVIRGTAAARQEMANRIDAENKVLGILGTTETAAAKALIETDLANRRRAQGIESATQITVEYADASTVLRDRMLELAQAETAGADASSVARARREADKRFNRDRIDDLEETESPFDGVEAGMRRLQDETGTLASTISGELSSSLQDGVSNFVDLAQTGELTWDSLGEGLESFATDITASIAKVLIMKAILGSLGLGGPGAAAGGGGADGSAFGGFFHQGGMVGEGGARRAVDPQWFKDAPRYHSGGLVLGKDEIPVIAQRGERIQSRQEVAGQWGTQKSPRPVVNIYNSTGEPVEQKERDGPNGVELDVMIGGSVNRHIASGRAGKPLEGKYNMRRRLY